MKRLKMKKGFYLFHFGITGVYDSNTVLFINNLVIDPNEILQKLRKHLLMDMDESYKNAFCTVDLNKTIIYSVSYLGDEEK